MLPLVVFYTGALMLCWTRLCEVLQVSCGQQLIPAHDPAETEYTFPSTKTSSASAVPHLAPCFVDDLFALLREDVGNGGELTNSSWTLFGICTASDSSGPVLSELAKEVRRTLRDGLEVLHPTKVLVSEEDERGTHTITFDLPQSPLLKRNPVLLLAFEGSLTGGDLDVAFTSQSLQPNTQSVCISGETQYILLTGNSSEDDVPQKWKISVETKSPDTKQSLKDILSGGESGRNIRMTPLLLFSGETGTDTRLTQVLGSSSASLQTSFLCELKRFLGAVQPQDHPVPPVLQLDSLESLPPLPLGLSSSETLLAGLINSSAPTVFSLTRWCSIFPEHYGELAMSPALSEELRQRLEHTVIQIMEIIREGMVAHRAAERLGRLQELCAFPKKEPAAGESQYCAFILLKALQTVAHANSMQRSLRATRADSGASQRGDECSLRSFTVSLEKLVVGPNTANINNCQGSCTVPLTNPNNHAVLINSLLREPCCVPVDYDSLQVVNFEEHGTSISTKPDMIAKTCGCR
ncbi:muellerian-inhibiting factor [Brachyistius frenatus]|uniref:muellerian-inhibiting factor n=1 Tax=Brachyistius frenatus TaxID=100188 RepID=UPI0037E85965